MGFGRIRRCLVMVFGTPVIFPSKIKLKGVKSVHPRDGLAIVSQTSVLALPGPRSIEPGINYSWERQLLGHRARSQPLMRMGNFLDHRVRSQPLMRMGNCFGHGVISQPLMREDNFCGPEQVLATLRETSLTQAPPPRLSEHASPPPQK